MMSSMHALSGEKLQWLRTPKYTCHWQSSVYWLLIQACWARLMAGPDRSQRTKEKGQVTLGINITFVGVMRCIHTVLSCYAILAGKMNGQVSHIVKPRSKWGCLKKGTHKMCGFPCFPFSTTPKRGTIPKTQPQNAPSPIKH